MQISTDEMPGGITRVALDGRMDIAGAAVVDLKMNLIAGSAKKLLIDLQKVDFLGSMACASSSFPRGPSIAAAARWSCLRPTPWWNRSSKPAASIPCCPSTAISMPPSPRWHNLCLPYPRPSCTHPIHPGQSCG